MGFRKTLTIILLSLILAPGAAMAQYATAPADTTSEASPSSTAFKSSDLIAPGIIGGTGLLIHFFGHDTIDASVHDWTDNMRGDRDGYDFDNYIQYIPLTMDLGLGLVGVPAQHGFVDRFIEGSISHLSLGICSLSGKILFHTLRPNGVDYRSFPSGHTDLVFTGAELVRMEYGWGWGGVAYATATTVAFMRLYNNWHWLSDVIFGAGLGILSAHVGGWLLEPTKNLLGIRTNDWGSGHKKVQAAIAPTVDPYSGAFCAALALTF